MAHLHGILASRSPAAILIKRGPGRQSCTIGWDRRTDTFSVGQWLRKTIDPHAADLSPDGQHFVHYCNDHSWLRPNHVYRAISRAPWLKALVFWGTAPREYGPGTGLFFRGTDGIVRFASRTDARPEWDLLGIEVVLWLPEELRPAMATPDTNFFVRLQRDGWVARTAWERCPPAEREAIGSDRMPRGSVHRIVFEKELRFGWTLRQTHQVGPALVPNRGVSWETFALVSPTGEVDPRPSWEWADAEPDRPRVVFTEDCVLRAVTLSRSGLGAPETLLDTRGMTFERRTAPY